MSFCIDSTDPRCLDLPRPLARRQGDGVFPSEGDVCEVKCPGSVISMVLALALHGCVLALLASLGMGAGMSHGVITVSLLTAGGSAGHADGSGLPAGGVGLGGGASPDRAFCGVGEAEVPAAVPQDPRPDGVGEDAAVADEQPSVPPAPPEPVASVDCPEVAELVPAVEEKSVSSPEPVAVKVPAEEKKPVSPPEPRVTKSSAMARKTASSSKPHKEEGQPVSKSPGADSKPATTQSSAVASGADAPASPVPAEGADVSAAGTGSGGGPASGPTGGGRGPVGIGGPGIGGGAVSAGFGASDGPRFVRRVEPRYPEIARRRGREGRVVLRLVIGAGGELRHAEVIEGGGHGFEEAALAAVRASEYAPAVRGGRPVECAALLPIRFSLRGS